MPSVILTWEDQNSPFRQEEEVRIYRSFSSFDAGSLPSVLATLPADTLTYEDSTVVEGGSYYYAVAFERGGVLAIEFTGEIEVGAAAPLYRYDIDYIPATDLTDFPIPVDLSMAPSSFWTNVRSDGGNIRVYASAGGAQYPLDIAAIHHNAQNGTMWVKVPLVPAAGGASFVIELGPSTQQREARDATYGSAAVWSDYESVFLGGENPDDHASTTRLFYVDGDCVSFLNVGNPEMTFAADPHQGGTWHEGSGEIYTSDDNALRRYDAAGTLLTSNTNPNADIMAATGMTGLVHLDDICVVGDWLIVPTNDYPSNTKCAIAVYDRTTLTLVAATNVSATEPKISGICWNEDLQQLVTCNWGTFNTLFKFDLNMTTGAVTPNGTIALNRINTSGSLSSAIQGIEYWRGHYWMTDDTRDEVVRVKPNGDYHWEDCPIQFSDADAASVSGNYEGIFRYKDGLAILVDPSSANSYLIYSRPANFDFGGGGARYGTNTGFFEATGLTGGTTFTFGASGARSAAQQHALASFRDFSSGGTNDRLSLAHRLVSGSYRLEAWDNVNGWISPGTPINPTTGAFDRLAVVYSGTSRELFVNGVSRASQTGITARDVDFDTLTVGADDTTRAESFDGDLAFVYIRLEALSADWLAAEHAMVSNPGTFGSITEL